MFFSEVRNASKWFRVWRMKVVWAFYGDCHKGLSIIEQMWKKDKIIDRRHWGPQMEMNLVASVCTSLWFFFSSTQLCERSEEMATTIFSKFKIPKFHALLSFLLGHLGYFFFVCFASSFLFCVCHTIYQVYIIQCVFFFFSIFTEIMLTIPQSILGWFNSSPFNTGLNKEELWIGNWLKSIATRACMYVGLSLQAFLSGPVFFQGHS